MALRLTQSLSGTLPDTNGRGMALAGLVGLAALAGFLLPFDTIRPLLLGAGAGLVTLGAGAGLVRAGQGLRTRASKQRALAEFETETAPAFLTDRQGRLVMHNVDATAFPDCETGARLADLLTSELAEPGAILNQMIGLAGGSGAARRELASGRSLSLRTVADAWLIWTIAEAPLDSGVSPLPVFRVSDDGEILSRNAAATRLFGAKATDLDGVLGETSLRDGGSLNLKTLDGECRMTSVIAAEQGGGETITLVPQINTETPANSGTVLAQPGLLDALPVPMLKIAADGTLIEANSEARSIFGLRDAALPPLFELVEGMGRPIADWLADAAEGRGLLKPEIVRAVVPGQELFLQIALGRMLENNEVVLVGILNDATELKTLEAQFVQSQKMQAIGQLAGGVAHDFNNLLTAISGHCDLLLLRHDAGDPEYSDLIQISQNANRAASLVGQLLAFSRKQNLKPQSLDIRDTMSDLAHLLNRLIGERIQLEVTHELGPQTIRADRRQLEQVIVNLVVNARDAMPDGGTISVRTRPEFLDGETMRDRAKLTPGSYVVIEVADTGTGIGPEGLSKIFEPFYTTKKTGEGTGLGLSTAYGIVKQTGGFIFVDSELGKGTTFSLYFRATQKKDPEVAPEAPKEDRAVPTDGVILLVEDEAPVRAFAARALRLRGYTVVEAECAEDALEILSDEALAFDMFVTDVIMPGLDGPTWVRQALKNRPDTPVIFMSGYAEEGRAEKQARIPNSVFLPKPFSLQKLTSLVQEQLS